MTELGGIPLLTMQLQEMHKCIVANAEMEVQQTRKWK